MIELIHDLNIPDTYRPAVITATATLIGAFLGAIVAQYFSHRMTLRRDNQKYYKEVYQKLYAPILFDVYAYIDIASHFRRGHDIHPEVKEEDIYKKILMHIEKNLMYATPRLISKFHQVKRYEYEDDMSGFHYRIHEIELLESFLEELRSVALRSSSLDKGSFSRIINNLIYCRVWIILTEKYSDDKVAASILAYKFYYSSKKLRFRTFKKIRSYYKTETFKHAIYAFLNRWKDSKLFGFSKLNKILVNKFYNDFRYYYRHENVSYLYKNLTSNKEYFNELMKNTPTEFLHPEGYAGEWDISHFIKDLSIVDISYDISGDVVKYVVTFTNWGDELVHLSVNDFALIKANDLRLPMNITGSYFVGLKDNLTEYSIFPRERISLLLEFSNFKTEFIKDYRLAMEVNKKCYFIHKTL